MSALFFFSARQLPPPPPTPQWATVSSFWRFLHHTQRRTTVGRTPLDASSARRADLYLTTDNTHNRQIHIPRWDSNPAISAGERPQAYASDRTSTGTGTVYIRAVNTCQVDIASYGTTITPSFVKIHSLHSPAISSVPNFTQSTAGDNEAEGFKSWLFLDH